MTGKIITLENGVGELYAKSTIIPLNSKNNEDEFFAYGHLASGEKVAIYRDSFNFVYRMVK